MLFIYVEYIKSVGIKIIHKNNFTFNHFFTVIRNNKRSGTFKMNCNKINKKNPKPS